MGASPKTPASDDSENVPETPKLQFHDDGRERLDWIGLVESKELPPIHSREMRDSLLWGPNERCHFFPPDENP